jgi:hypothetical protein
MFTSRFVKFKAVIESEDGGGVITNLRINPMCIEAYVEDNVSYTINGVEVEEAAIRAYTRNDVYNILIPIDKFERILNEMYQ